MNVLEAAKLLACIQAYDGREVTEASARAWALALPDVELEDAMEWLPGYFREYTGIGLERLVPKHVLDGSLELRARRRRAVQDAAFNAAIEAGQPAEALAAAARAGRQFDGQGPSRSIEAGR